MLLNATQYLFSRNNPCFINSLSTAGLCADNHYSARHNHKPDQQTWEEKGHCVLREVHPNGLSAIRDVPDWLMNKSLSCKAVVRLRRSDRRIGAAVNKSLAVHRTNKQAPPY